MCIIAIRMRLWLHTPVTAFECVFALSVQCGLKKILKIETFARSGTKIDMLEQLPVKDAFVVERILKHFYESMWSASL